MSIRRTALVFLALVALTTTSTTAFAYWTTAGSGEGTVTVGSMHPLVINQVPVKGLVPGPVARSLTIVVNNPNEYSVSIPAQVLVAKAWVDRSTCIFAQNFQLVLPMVPTATIPAHGHLNVRGASIRLVDLAQQDQNACKGAKVTLKYTLTG